ncbi:hypothetical protein GI482_05505 [Bacillus sp. N3536]|nr:hypothetical protein GI482_05505 [Bacillus sp. N3536]
MKLFLATIALLVSFYIIKVDLFEGTIPLAYSSEIQMEKCIESPNYIVAEIMPGETIYSLFAIYPTSEDISFTKRLNDFYELNPHLKNQSFHVGEKVFLPVYTSQTNCKKEN